MANEASFTKGSYTSIISSAAIATGAVSAESSSIATALGAAEEVYTMLDFKLDVTAGTIVNGAYFNLYRRAGDGTDQAPAVTTSYLQQPVGVFVMSGAADEFYLYGVENCDENDTYYVVNNDAASITCQLFVRARTIEPAA